MWGQVAITLGTLGGLLLIVALLLFAAGFFISKDMGKWDE
jgi:hypothetical protein